MFDSLADRIKQDQKLEVNATERVVRLLAVVLISVLIFGGLYFVIRVIEK